MDSVQPAEAIEWTVDGVAAATLAAAAGYAAWHMAAGDTGLAAAAAAIAFVGGYWRLRRVAVEQPAVALPAFELHQVPQDHGDELLLDDPLDEVTHDDRVVRLFDPRAEAEDPNDALHAALAEIRRSLLR